RNGCCWEGECEDAVAADGGRQRDTINSNGDGFSAGREECAVPNDAAQQNGTGTAENRLRRREPAEGDGDSLYRDAGDRENLLVRGRDGRRIGDRPNRRRSAFHVDAE